MKKVFIFFYLFFLLKNSFGFNNGVNSSNLYCYLNQPDSQQIDGIFLSSNSLDVFTGESLCFYDNVEQIHSKGTISNGLKEGEWIFWYENGIKKEEQYYLNSKLVGLKTLWYDNGQKESEIQYGDFIIGKHGKSINW